MPPRFPTYEDVPLPGIQGPRPVAGYDVSAYGQGTQALAQGVQNVGQGIEKGAEHIAQFETYKARNNALLAQDQIIGDVYKAREEFKHDTDYDTLTDRWDKKVDDIVSNGIQNVPEGPLRTHVAARLQIPLARTRDSIEDYAFNGRSQQAHADLYGRANNLVQATGASEDPLIDGPGGQAEQYGALADRYVEQKLITPLQAQEYKQKLALNRADARARARIDQNPAEAAKVENELRNSIPRPGMPGGAAAPGTGASIYPPGGWGPTDHAASVTAKAETGDATLGPKALGNISPDKSGSKSYGFMGLNSGTGSANAFALQYGRQFGLTARPGSAAFDQQWKDAAANQTGPFRQAQLAFFNERVIPTITADLTKRGIPDNIANDPRVVTYFADRKVQMGIAGIDAVREAWGGAGGDPVRFLRNMNDVDRRNIDQNFKTTLAERLYSPEGNETRLRTRLEGALSTGTGAPPDMQAPDESPPDYVVGQGDTLNSVAQKYGVTPDELIRVNGLSGPDVQMTPGLRLKVPPSDNQAQGYTGDPLFAKLTPQHRDALIAHAQQVQRQSNTEARVSLQKNIADDLAAAARDGYLGQGRTMEEFRQVYGDGAEDAFMDYSERLQMASDMHHMAGMSPAERIAIIEMHKPDPSQPGYAERAKMHDGLSKAADALNKQFLDDPAGYMLRNSPAVGDAWQKLQGATSPQEQTQAAQTFAQTTIDEQRRFGLPESDIKVVPDSYAENFRANVEKLAAAGNANQIGPLIKAESERWGTAWPQVYKQVTDGDPMLRVVGAGVKSAAGQILTTNAKVKFGDIVKDEQSAKAKDIRDSVDTALTPFARSLGGAADAIPLYNDVRGQVEKLAAIYAFQNGMDATSAAKQAVADTIDFKYEYRDGYRIPAKEHSNPAPVPADDIQAGAAIARAHLGENYGGLDLAVKPALDTFGGAYTPAQLASETADAKRTGQWATNGDESGLWYTYNGRIVKRPDGKDLQFTWKQLADLAKGKGAASGLEQYGTALP